MTTAMFAPRRVSKRAAAIQAVGKIKASLDHLNQWDAAGNEIKKCKPPVESVYNPHGEIQAGQKRQRKTCSLPINSNDDASKACISTVPPSKARILRSSDGSMLFHNMNLFEVCDYEGESARFSSSGSSSSHRSSTVRPISLTEIRGYENRFAHSCSGSSISDSLFSSDDVFASSSVSCPEDSIEHQHKGKALPMKQAKQKVASHTEKSELRRHHSGRDMFLSKRMSRKIHAKSLSPLLSPLKATCLLFSPEFVAQIKTARDSHILKERKKVGRL